MLETIIIILLSILLVGVGVILVVFLTSKKAKSNAEPQDFKEIGAISKQLDMLSTSLQKDIQIAVQQEILKVNDAQAKSNETNNQKLEVFQQTIVNYLNNRFDAMNQALESKLIEMNKKVDEKIKEGFTTTSETMTQVRERLQAIDDAQKNIQSLSQDVVSLKNVLQGNQTRGQYGEYQLSMVLHNVFGDTQGCYEEQFTMKKTKDGNDVRADAVVFMPEPNKMICIDSKFPFAEYAKMFETESEEEKQGLISKFNADVKKHITAIKNKYIVEGKTAPEALMFIPNDGVFAFIHHNCLEAVEYARDCKVIITSPSTLPAILVTINMVRIEAERAKNVQEISKQLATLGKQFELFARDWDVFSKQLETASKSREKLDSRVNRITTKFDSIKGNDVAAEIENIEELQDLD